MLNHPKNNIDFIRIIAALFVLYSHQHALMGLPEPSVLGAHSLGGFGVLVFFSISGFLVAQSWHADPSFYRFALKRMLRIWPAMAVAVLLASQVLLAYTFESLWGTAAALLVFFAAFNLLEATLPSLISKIAPVGAKGTAIGVYSSVQFLGAFVGATAGGYLFEHHGSSALFAFCGVLLTLWLLFAATMKAPAAVRTKMYHVEEMDTGKASGLSRQLAALPGVHEALVLASEGVAYLKVDMRGFDEKGVVQLLGGEA